MIRIGVLASGGGTNLQAIIDACERGDIDGSVVIVISDKADAYSLVRARKRGIEAVSIPPEGTGREEHEKLVDATLQKARVDLVVLAGYMRILTPWFINRYLGRMMNIHPALLPSFGGKGMYGEHVHRAVIEYGCKLSGCTVHFVVPEVDGGPIIIQESVPVLEEDTPDSLASRIHPLEHKLYPKAIALFASGKLKIEGRRVRIID
ncbi:MAG: phosphoribosylglycinamide formyltransferase [Thermoplasmata archaeon]|nr:phosphoribosylglycinamide formyltransferase [Thermoplasmata archaeon]